MTHLIPDIAMSIVTAWLLGVGANLVRQPLILAYLLAGFLLGPSGLAWVRSQDSISVISELGLIFMLFMIGLEIDLKKTKQAGPVILVTAWVQIIGSTVLGTLLFVALGSPFATGSWDALYLGIATALSSTVIIVKILYDKRELDTLPGRLTLGILVLQDLFAILFLALQPSLNDLQPSVIAMSLARVIILIAAALLVSRFLLPLLFRRIARLPELVVVGALAWCLLLSEFAEYLHLSRAMGALLAGVSLSTFPYALDVTAKVTALRDFFITLFFVGLGMMVAVPTRESLAVVAVLVVFTLVSRPLTMLPPLLWMKNGLRASLLPVINLAQMSEFSLVLIQLGLKSGQIRSETATASSVAFVILAILSSFVMLRSDPLARKAITGLKFLGVRDLSDDMPHKHEGEGMSDKSRILLLGFYRTASSLLSELEQRKSDLVDELSVVDFNPLVFRTLRARGVRVLYGDIANLDTLAHAGLAKAEIVISSVPDSLLKGTTNAKLVRQIREANPQAKIIATAEVLSEAELLYQAGADFVSIARLAEASDLVEAILAADDGLLDQLRQEAEPKLRDRSEVLP